MQETKTLTKEEKHEILVTEFRELTFERAAKSWKKSAHFKDKRVDSTLFNEQYELLRDLESILTIDEKTKISILQLDYKLAEYVLTHFSALSFSPSEEIPLRSRKSNDPRFQAFFLRMNALYRFIQYVERIVANKHTVRERLSGAAFPKAHSLVAMAMGGGFQALNNALSNEEIRGDADGNK